MKEEEDGYGQAAYLHTIDSGAINFMHVYSILISVLLSYITVGLRSKVDNQRACMLFPYCPEWKMQGRVLLHVFANRGLISLHRDEKD